MEALQAVQARIAEIQGLARSFALAGPSRAAAGTNAAATSFESVLAGQLGDSTTANGALRPAVQKAPGQYGSLTPPAELTGYGNGRIPSQALSSIGVGEHRLYAPAAQSFRQLLADASRDGVTIGVSDSYRSYDEQVQLAAEKGLYGNGGLAATPGTSNHGWGLALDLELDTQAQSWMRDNGWRYGFVEDVPREPWHWTYRPA